MGHPKKDDSRKESNETYMLDAEEVKVLAHSIIKIDKAKLEEMDDPLEFYAQKMKMRWHKDAKLFGNYLIKGYEILLEQTLKE